MIATLIAWAIGIAFITFMKWKFPTHIIVEPDKIKHFVIGALIPIIVMFAGWYTNQLNFQQTIWIGFGLSVLAGAVKELVIDKWLKMGVCSIWDFLATFCGAFGGTFLFVLPVLNSQS